MKKILSTISKVAFIVLFLYLFARWDHITSGMILLLVPLLVLFGFLGGFLKFSEKSRYRNRNRFSSWSNMNTVGNSGPSDYLFDANPSAWASIPDAPDE
ncbi:MAG: hypothetical protein LBS40_00905 [Burkholderiales bacterium]|jgi:hypothetical protein|nr:hypothetical protein [Burkholderiales bacterium]